MAQNLGSVLPGLGNALGTGLAQPINQHLDLLAQDKLMQLQEAAQSRQMQRQAAFQQQAALKERERYAQGLAPLLGNEAASFLSNLNPEERKFALQNLGALQQLTGAQGGQAESGQSMTGLQSLLPGQQQTSREGRLVTEPLPENAPAGYKGIQSAPTASGDRQKLIENLFTSPAEKRQRELLDLQRQKAAAQKEQFGKTLGLKQEQLGEQRAKSVREWSEPYTKKAEAAEKDTKEYEQIIKLVETGKVRSGAAHQLLKKFGLEDFGANLETQLTGKLLSRLQQNIQTSGFGGKVTNFLEQTFQRSLARLENTNEGIIALSKMAIEANKLPKLENEERKKLLQEWNGKIPYNADDIVKERARQRADQINDQIIRIGQNAIDKSEVKIGEKVGKRTADSFEVGTIFTNPKTGEKKTWNGTQVVDL